MKIMNDEGVEIEVYTAEEVKTQTETAVSTAVKAKEVEFGKTKAEIDTELANAKKALGERAAEFGQFRKLNEETVAKLTVAERTIYENQKSMAEEKEKNQATEKAATEARVTAAIRAKVGTDEKLFTKVKGMYDIIGIEAKTPEEIEKKTLAALGALGQTEPDLVATVAGFSGGSYTPPVVKKEGEGSFADSERGKSGAAELGLKFPEAKK